MAVATATMMLVVTLAIFLSFIELMIQFVRLIDRVLSPYAQLTNLFISCQLFGNPGEHSNDIVGLCQSDGW
jgi:hypothetical protein